MRIKITFISILLLLVLFHSYRCEKVKNSEVIELKSENDDEDVVWIVQLSDLHFSVHYPQRAVEFRNFVAETLAMIKPALVLITGDLTDGKSKDHLIMKQNEEEWVEYQKTMENVITTSGLDKSVFYDLRGNHDNFGVAVGGAFDYFSNYSINGQLGRSQSVNSVTLQSSNRNHLFVSLDSTMSTGLRGPTNLFGHPTDQLLSELNSHLSQWDSMSAKPLTKIAFGHFPLSFSAPSKSKRTLKEIFLKNSITAYLCGHLHLKFGENLKRHHEVDNETYHSLFQLNMRQKDSSSSTNCSNGGQTVNEFWELEMGDWRKSRAMRVMAIDKGRVSFIDTDLKMGAKKMLILPTYPLDSRFLSTTAMNKYKCESMEDTSHIRALVFSSRLITSVKAKIYDSSHGHLDMVLEASMAKKENLYTVPWNSKAFIDSSPDRYLLQIEAIDINGDISLTELMPFSVNGFHSDLSWTWIEFFVLGIQWSELYYPILFSFYFSVSIALVLPKIIISVENTQYTYKYFKANKSLANGLTWVFAEVDKIPILWKMMVAYLLYLLLCPWVLGKVFTEGSDRGYMTYKGWVVNFDDIKHLEFIGFPDIMVVVVNHLYFVVLPSILIIGAVAAERSVYQDHVHSLSGKKRDDHGVYNERSRSKSGNISKQLRKWARGILVIFSLAVCWKHFKVCII
ncbi:Metallophosphoesterase domain-containing protein [Artemisia annua]|uniref:Metallophosphoesterase domain-containing protein n=1 Tax=Artemisia annua TaxID=35608 RepID=A0A2U1MJX1_ARTAN|nr:Metallophosphoesterase domain-containing protein [Artemisia annua]